MNHHYSDRTGEYLGDSEVTHDQDKRAEIPAFSTYKAVPTLRPGQAAVFKAVDGQVPIHGDGDWLVVTDHRGDYWLPDGSKGTITELGIDRPAGALLEQPEPPPPTTAQLVAERVNAVQRHLDSTLRAKGYDSILSACTYVGSTVQKFNQEGNAALSWRDACWAKCLEVLAEVQAGNHPLPTAEELLNELPQLAWPE